MTKENSFIIKDRLPSLNDYITACRSNKFKGATFKKDIEKLIGYYIMADKKLGLVRSVINPVRIIFEWHERTVKRDLDNIFSAKKYILDTMQDCEILVNDNQRYVKGLEDIFIKDKEDFVKVTLIELEG